MQKEAMGYLFSDEAAMMQPEQILALLRPTPWAAHYTPEIVAGVLANSVCMGAFYQGEQIAFGRCVTDATTVFYLEDVVVHPAHRGRGVGQMLLRLLLERKPICDLKGILVTEDAFSLYERFGFERDHEIFMKKVSPVNGCF